MHALFTYVCREPMSPNDDAMRQKLKTETTRPMAWLVRSIRHHSNDAEISDTKRFGRRLLAQLEGTRVKNPRVDKLETLESHNQLDETKLRGYEQALDLQPSSLVDIFHYLQGNRRLLEAAPFRPSQEPDALYEVLYQHGAEDVHEWTAVARAIGNWRYEFPKGPEKIATPLFDDIKRFDGRSFYVLRNSAVMLKRHLSQVMNEELGSDPVHGYHLIEPLGLIGDSTSTEHLLALAISHFDTWVSGALIEAIRRSAATARFMKTKPDFAANTKALILSHIESENYATQHQAALFGIERFPDDLDFRTRVAKHPNFDVSNTLAQRKHDFQDPTWRLALDLDAPIEEEMEAASGFGDMRVELIHTAIFGRSRIDRSEAAWVLSASPYQDALVRSVARILPNPAGLPEEYQRNLVRLVGRVGGPSAPDVVRVIAQNPRLPESIRVASLWDLPGLLKTSAGLKDHLAPVWLTRMLDEDQPRHVQRAIVTAIGGIGDRRLLGIAASDPRAMVRVEANRWLT